MNVIKGKQETKIRMVLYGVEGIGKTTLASQFPKPLFIDTEAGTNTLDVDRIEPTSWQVVKDTIAELTQNQQGYKTLVIDTIDWLEKLCIQYLCNKANVESIETFGYGKGYTYLADEFAKMLNNLTVLRKSMHIILIGHSIIKKFERPDEIGAYDRYELKLEKKTSPLVKEWGDCLLFCNYKTFVTEINGKKKASGNKRILYTTHTATWDAKNRYNLESELEMTLDNFKVLFSSRPEPKKVEVKKEPLNYQRSVVEPEEVRTEPPTNFQNSVVESVPKPKQETIATQPTAFNTALYDLMRTNNVTELEIRQAQAGANGGKGYYPIDTKIDVYDEKFVNGILVACWDKVFEMIKQNRSK